MARIEFTIELVHQVMANLLNSTGKKEAKKNKMTTKELRFVQVD